MTPVFSFNPPPPIAAAVLDDLCDHSLSLADIARSAGIPVEALSAWIIRPDIQEKLAALATAASLRARLLAALNLPSAVEIIASALKGYTADENACAGRDTPEAIAVRQTRRADCRRAANLLLRIARYRFDPTPHSPPARVRVLAGEGFVSSPSSPSPLHQATDHATGAPPPDSSVSHSISTQPTPAQLNEPRARDAQPATPPSSSLTHPEREAVPHSSRPPSKPARDAFAFDLPSSALNFTLPRSSNSPLHLLTSSPPQPAGP